MQTILLENERPTIKPRHLTLTPTLTPPLDMTRWQWEESLSALRNQAHCHRVSMHWNTTGNMAVDATARGHIAEWLVLDEKVCDEPCYPSPDHEQVSLALQTAHWDLYTVEAVKDDALIVRGLRDQKGRRIDWLEGRTFPESGSIVALRIFSLGEGTRTVASTLPLVFGDTPDAKSMIMALLRAFGQSPAKSWRQFMAAMGARILLEYALAALEERARQERSAPDPLLEQTRRLESAFSMLEAACFNGLVDPETSLELSDGRLAFIEDVTDGPNLMIVADEAARRRYVNACLNPTLRPLSSTGSVRSCRVRRVSAPEIHPVEWEICLEAGLSPEQNGYARHICRDELGRHQDPTPQDFAAIEEACLRFSADTRSETRYRCA